VAEKYVHGKLHDDGGFITANLVTATADRETVATLTMAIPHSRIN
jgi:hypothetical protein